MIKFLDNCGLCQLENLVQAIARPEQIWTCRQILILLSLVMTKGLDGGEGAEVGLTGII